jgi:hypothetical protein
VSFQKKRCPRCVVPKKELKYDDYNAMCALNHYSMI